MSFKTLAGAVLAATLSFASAPTSAYADAADITAAEITNSLDQVAAASVSTDPNLTCDVKAGGRDLVQHTNYVVGEIYGQDFGEATAECASLDTSRTYYAILRVRIEYFTSTGLTTGYWTPVPGCDVANRGDSIYGVAVPTPPVVTCTYPGTSGYLNRYHRAHAILTPSVAGATVRHAYSPTWFMAP